MSKRQTTGTSLELDTDGSGGGGGDATAANQLLEIAELVSIDNKLTNPLPVSATNLDIRDLAFATDKVDVSGSAISATVAGTVAVSNFPASQAVTGPLTDTQLRASAVPVSGTVTTGGLTDTQLRATPVPVSGTISSKTTLTPSSPTASTVGVASAQAVAANASRKGLILTNTSINTISLGLAAAAVLNSGITLYPGGSFSIDEYSFVIGAINAIASAASSNLTVQEFT